MVVDGAPRKPGLARKVRAKEGVAVRKRRREMPKLV